MTVQLVKQQSVYPHREVLETMEATDIGIYLFSSCELHYVALQHICGKGSGFRLLGRTNDLPDDLANVASMNPHLAIVDLKLVTGSRARSLEEALKPVCNITRVIVLADQLDISCACRVIASGAHGYILSSAALSEFLQAFRVIAVGGTWLGQQTVRALAEQLNEPRLDETPPVVRLLSQREQEILDRVARGETSKEIAKTLFLSESSVRTYWYRVLSKLNALNKAEAIARAARLGLLDSAAREEEEALLASSPKLRTILQERLRVTSGKRSLPPRVTPPLHTPGLMPS